VVKEGILTANQHERGKNFTTNQHEPIRTKKEGRWTT